MAHRGARRLRHRYDDGGAEEPHLPQEQRARPGQVNASPSGAAAADGRALRIHAMSQHGDLHVSLYPELAGVLVQAMPAPLVPIIDGHMHVGDVEATRPYVEAARAYGITGALA